MKNTKNRNILFGLALLGTTLIGFNSPASARPGDRRDDRRDVKQAKREVKEAKRDVKEAKRDLRDERREARQPNRRPVVVRPVVRRPVVVRPVTRPGYNRPNYNRPTYNRPNYNRPNYNRPNYNRPNYGRTTNVVAYDGYVTKDTSGNDFEMRLSNGRVITVYALNGEPGSLSKGDLVHVRGYNSGGVLRAEDVDIRRNR